MTVSVGYLLHDGGRMRIKVQDKTVWHRWFAWYPLWSQDKKEYIFWEYVEVKLTHGVYDSVWEYRYDG